jgi:hypothetical protein
MVKSEQKVTQEKTDEGKDYITFISMFFDAFCEGLVLAKEAEDNGLYLFKHYNYPSITYYDDNGMPRFYDASGDNVPKDYGCIFRGKSLSYALMGREPVFSDERFPKKQTLVHFSDNSKTIKLLFVKPEFEDSPLASGTGYRLRAMLGDCIDRYIHLYNTFEIDDKKFQSVFFPLFLMLIQSRFRVTIVIPIAVVPFEFNRLKISNGAYIMRMNDVFQLSRWRVKNHGSGAHENVVGAATHAFVLTGWEFNDIADSYDIERSISSLEAFPRKEIDMLFAALRIGTGYGTGYAQLIYWPRGWAYSYTAGLFPLSGTTVRQYPQELDNYGWKKKFSVLTKADAKLIGQLYAALLDCGHPQIGIAIKRLNSCFLRDNEEDTIIDACIGLEALLSDGDGNEMTHKLALRFAALKRLNNEDVSQIFKDVKEIYAVRSSIVHGSKRSIKKNKMTKEDAARKSVEFLSDCIKILLQNKDFLNPTEIDRKLLLGS